MRYTPNLTDKRTKARITNAVAWAKASLSAFKETEVSQSTIIKHLGQQQHDLSRWLKKRLLIVSDNHYSMDHGLCKKYLLNSDGVNELTQLLGLKKEVTVEWAESTFKEELTSADFAYNDKANRLWTPLQNVKADIRDTVLKNNGFIHKYDIQCCAPTLLYQHALEIGLSKPCPAINEYLTNRKSIRNRIAKDTSVDVNDVKMIINALFAGAYLSASPKCKIYKQIQNVAKINALKDNRDIVLLMKEIKLIWKTLRHNIPVTGSRIRSTDKWRLYFSLERQVMDSVRSFLDMNGDKYLLEHDGWTSMNEIDISLCENYVRQMSGYAVQLEYECLS